MTGQEDLLISSLEKLFVDICSPEAVLAAEAAWPASMWAALENAGLTLASVPEERGGSGGSVREALAVLQLAGRFACPVPIGETALLAGWILAESGLSIPRGPLTVASDGSISFQRTAGGYLITGSAARVPWARVAHIVAVGAAGGDALVATVEPSECVIQEGSNLASEPRDSVQFRVEIPLAQVGPVPPSHVGELRYRGAMARTLMMAGTLGRVLELSVEQAANRVQFGHPIGKFQAIQHYLAIMAGHVASTEAAAEALINRSTELRPQLVAAAKASAGEAATVVARLAHQIHGAIGVTREHQLQLFTRRLLAWRDEYGSEHEWAEQLGKNLSHLGSDQLWPALTSTA